MVDVRFATALQVMLNLAYAERCGIETVTSAKLAESLGANPSLVRKLLVSLVRDGLVTSFLGKNGGVRLGRAASAITLRDLHVSVLSDKRIFSARLDVPHRCLVSSNIERVLDEISTDIEETVLKRLEARTLDRLLDEIVTADVKQACSAKASAAPGGTARARRAARV